MACSEYYASPEEYLDFWCVQLNQPDEADQVKNYLRRAASTVNMARQAQGACDCTLSAASSGYLRDMTIVLAVIYHKCPCGRPKLTIDEQRMYMEQVTEELRMIRVGETELCDGATGADFPAIAWAEQSLTDFTTAQIIVNRQRRNQ